MCTVRMGQYAYANLEILNRFSSNILYCDKAFFLYIFAYSKTKVTTQMISAILNLYVTNNHSIFLTEAEEFSRIYMVHTCNYSSIVSHEFGSGGMF